MPDTIRDGKGKGYLASVTACNRLLTDSVSKNVEFVISKDFGNMYNISTTCEISAGNNHILYIKNNDPNRNLVVSEIKFQIINSTDLPNINNYLSLTFNPTLNTIGTTVNSINLRQGSGNIADITSYSCPDVTLDSNLEAFRVCPNNNELYTLDKRGSIMLNHNDSLVFTYNSNNDTGHILLNMLFGMANC